MDLEGVNEYSKD